jgi:hypothetical protein
MGEHPSESPNRRGPSGGHRAVLMTAPTESLFPARSAGHGDQSYSAQFLSANAAPHVAVPQPHDAWRKATPHPYPITSGAMECRMLPCLDWDSWALPLRTHSWKPAMM